MVIASSHDGVDADMAIEGSSRQHSWVSGTPLDVKAPLSTGGQLIQDLIEKTSQVTPHKLLVAPQDSSHY